MGHDLDDPVERSMAGRVLAQGRVIEFIAATLFAERGEAFETAFMEAVRSQDPPQVQTLPDVVAEWWADVWVSGQVSLDLMLERAVQIARELRSQRSSAPP